MDGDGLPDLIVHTFDGDDLWPDGFRVLRNRGDLTFDLLPEYDPPFSATILAARDMNADGPRDIVLEDEGTSTVCRCS